MRSRSEMPFSLLSIFCGLMVVSMCGGSRLLAVSKMHAGGPAAVSRLVRRLNSERYPYTSRKFDVFLAESQRICGPDDIRNFREWMDEAYSKCSSRFPGKENLGLEQLLKVKRRDISAIRNPWAKTQTEMALCAWLHKAVKCVIPKFSLDRGFEFGNVVRYGERQCFLQSVLIAGLLQDMGVDAGVAMVYRNERGEESNNGHAVTLVKLPNGQDITVDASEPYPFAAQQGLFVRHGSYRYVQPVYVLNSHRISSYRTAANSKIIRATQVRPLGYNFIRSQFYYYRGERAPGGLLSTNKTPEGLTSAGNALRTSIGYCPENPLSVYMLGRVYWCEGKFEQARAFFERAAVLYTKFGWLPAGPKEYLQLARQQAAPAPAAPTPAPTRPATSR